MAADLYGVFSGIGVGGSIDADDDIVQQLALQGAEGSVMERVPFRVVKAFTEELVCDRDGLWTGNSDDAYGATRRRRHRRNGILMV